MIKRNKIEHYLWNVNIHKMALLLVTWNLCIALEFSFSDLYEETRTYGEI